MKLNPAHRQIRGLDLLRVGALILLSASSALRAHEDEHTHMGLAAASIRLAGSPFTEAARQAILAAARDEDHQSDCSAVVPGEDSFYCHFFNPITNEGLNEGSFTSARDRAAQLWEMALQAYSVNPSNTGADGPYFILGRVLHLLQDMSSQAHTHDDAHVGALGDPEKCPGLAVAGDADDFENWGWCPGFGFAHIDDYVTEVSLAGEATTAFEHFLQEYFQNEPQFAKTADGAGFIRDVARLTYDLTTYDAILVTENPQSGAFELSRMFPTVAYGGFDWQFEIDNVGDWDGDCAGDPDDEWWAMRNPGGAASGTECSQQETAGGEEQTTGRFYIENSGGDDGQLSPEVWETDLGLGDCVADACPELLATFGNVLYSVAATYGGGLIKSFEWATQPPLVESHEPAAGSVAAAAGNILVVFTEPLSQSSLGSSSIQVVGSVSQSHAAVFSFSDSSLTLTINPIADFVAGETVTVTLSSGIKDRTGSGLDGSVSGLKGPGYQFAFLVAGSGTPLSPANLLASAASSLQIDLAWTDRSTNETGFQIRRSTSSGGPFAMLASVGANVASYGDTGLVGGTTYFYQVVAFNAQGDSGASNTASATASSGGGIPAAPSQLVARALSSSEISLSWRDNSANENGIKVERRDPGGDWFQITTLGANSTAYENHSLAGNTAYDYRVLAYNSGGISSPSNVSSATTETNAPAAPSNVLASAVDEDTVSVTWRDRSGTENGFEIERRIGAGGAWALKGYAGRNEEQWMDQFVSPNTNYYYRIRAHNAEGYSAYSSAAQVTTCVAPDTPYLDDPYSGEDDLPLDLDLVWWTDEAVASYDLYLGTVNPPPFVGSVEPAADPGDDTVYHVSGLSPGQVYFWRVVARAACNENLLGASLVRTFATTGTPEVPVLLSPVDGSGNVATGVVVDWANVTTPGSTLYDLYLGTTSPPPLFEAMGTVTERLMQSLSANSTYYWRVRAKNADNHDLFSESPIWSFSTGAGSSSTVTLDAVKDAGLRGGSFGGVNYGGQVAGPAEQTAFGAGNDDNFYQSSGNAPLRGAVQFDLSSIPGEVTVTNATLVLKFRQANGSQSVPLSIYFDPYVSAWTEKGAGGITWNSRPAVNTTHRVTGTFPLSGYNPLRNNLTALVQKWLDGTLANNGFEVSIPAWEGLVNQAKYFGQWENGGEFGAAQLEVTYTLPCSAPPAPLSPSPASGATGQAQAMTLNWADTAGASSYKIYLGTSPNPPFYAVSATSSLGINGLSPSTTYSWRVEALAGCDTGLATSSAEWSFQTGSCFAPAPPALASPVGGASGLPRLTDLVWGSVAGVGSYEVLLDTSNPPLTVVGSTATTGMQVGLSPGVTYFWKVRAQSACNGELATDSALGTFTTGVRPEAEAGPNRTVEIGVPTMLGGSPSGMGGSPPYVFDWTVSPAGAFLSSASAANPELTVEVPGSFTCELVVTDSKGFSSFVDQVVVTVPETPQISVTPGTLDFEVVEIGSFSELDFSVHNAGGGTLAGSALVSSPFSIMGSADYSLAAGETKIVTIRFTPTLDGDVSNQASFSGGGGAGRQLMGKGVPAGLVFRDGFESGGVGLWSGAASGAFACAHTVCESGSALASDCDPCVDAVETVDPYCTGVAWDQSCVAEVREGTCLRLSCSED